MRTRGSRVFKKKKLKRANKTTHQPQSSPPHIQAAGEARQGRRRRSRRGRRGGEGVVLAEADDDDDVPVTVDFDCGWSLLSHGMAKRRRCHLGNLIPI